MPQPIKKIDIRLNRTGGGMFHDSRADSRLLAKCINQLSEKLDEVIDLCNKQEEELTELRKKFNK